MTSFQDAAGQSSASKRRREMKPCLNPTPVFWLTSAHVKRHGSPSQTSLHRTASPLMRGYNTQVNMIKMPDYTNIWRKHWRSYCFGVTAPKKKKLDGWMDGCHICKRIKKILIWKDEDGVCAPSLHLLQSDSRDSFCLSNEREPSGFQEWRDAFGADNWQLLRFPLSTKPSSVFLIPSTGEFLHLWGETRPPVIRWNINECKCFHALLHKSAFSEKFWVPNINYI